jgi:hypothetical protein
MPVMRLTRRDDLQPRRLDASFLQNRIDNPLAIDPE